MKALLFLCIWVSYLIGSVVSNIPNVASRGVARSTRIQAADGVGIELLTREPSAEARDRNKAPLVFIHGSGAGGWIWDEHWLEFFADRGFPAIAVSLRGSEATGTLNGSTEPVRITEHVEDLKRVLKNLPVSSNKKPIVLGHSFGGLVLTKLCE